MGDNFLGEIRAFSHGVVPRGWLPCDGQVLQIRQYQALYALLGKQFGGDGQTTFALPDLRGRVGMAWGPPPSSPIGTAAGEETVLPTVAQIPPHNHQFNGMPSAATASPPSTTVLLGNPTAGVTLYATPTAPNTLVNLSPESIGNPTGGIAHENRQPGLALNFCIAFEGIWPSRQ